MNGSCKIVISFLFIKTCVLGVQINRLINGGFFFGGGGRSGSVVKCLTRDRGTRVRASLRYMVLEKDIFILA